MTWFIIVLVALISVARNQDLEGSTDINISLNHVDNDSLVFDNNSLSDFLFTLSNSSSFIGSRIDTDSNQVDCFGLGKGLATVLGWFFVRAPKKINDVDVKFFLSSRKQPERVRVSFGEQFGLEWTDFQMGRKTIMIVHGFLSHGQQSWIIDMEKSFLQWRDVNVIVVDWSAESNTWNYYKAVANTRTVGYKISSFLEHIENATIAQNGSDDDNWGSLHLVGHSLGAHICGFAAKELKKRQSKWKVQRITGLDPAQPCFKNANSSMKLHKSDASFVDVIHTNGRLLSEIGLGLPEPIGHVDFYPNGGRSQPGCLRTDSSYFKYLPIPVQAIDKSICSHGRSYIYLTESLISEVKRNCTFWAHHWNLSYRNLMQTSSESCEWDNCTEMGINAINYFHRGTFFVATSGAAPFCINNTQVIDEVIIQLERDYANELYD